MPVTTGALPATTAAETKPVLSKVIKPAILSNEAIFIMCLGRLRLAVTIIISLIRVNYFKANSAFTVTVIVLSSVEVSLFPSQVVAVEYIGFTWTTPIRAVRKCAITRPLCLAISSARRRASLVAAAAIWTRVSSTFVKINLMSWVWSAIFCAVSSKLSAAK
jgi:hypothetical protein